MKKTIFCKVIIIFVPQLVLMSSEYDECGPLETDFGHFAISDTRADDIYAPWLASLGEYNYYNNYDVLCSGSVLTVKIIITAAHCFENERHRPGHVRVGGNRRDNKYIVERGIREYKQHPDFTYPEYYYDVAIIILDNELIFSPHISPICLPQSVSSSPSDGTIITTQGWGFDDDGNSGETATSVSVGVRSKQECNYKFENAGSKYRDQVNRLMPQLIMENIIFCTEAELNSELGTCGGDSGGPAIQK